MKHPHLLIQQHLMPAKLEIASYACFAPLSGWRVVLLCQRPNVWQPSRHSVDEELKLQRQQQLLLQEYNVVLAGAWYWQPGLLRKLQAAQESLEYYVQRYAQHHTMLLAARKELLRAGQRLGLTMVAVGETSLRSVRSVEALADGINLLAEKDI